VHDTEIIMRDAEVYTIGLFSDLTQFIHNPDRKQARAHLRAGLKRMAGHIRRGDWGTARRYFDGYHAEHPWSPRVGTGWTKGRAFRDMLRHLDQAVTAAPEGADHA
jgi:hypothetical protein